MAMADPIRRFPWRATMRVLLVCTLLRTATQAQPAPVLLDEVVAVVNNQAILASDVRQELRESVLEPERSGGSSPTPRQALDELISRTLIQQQIRQEEAPSGVPSEQELQPRIDELRKNLPACRRFHCTTAAGWTAFLNQHELTQQQVEDYLRKRMEILSFIEDRFRQGIRISQQEIEDYYNQTLLPQYSNGTPAPSLTSVAPRISEILLQQQVNVLFDAWLENLRKQGDVEILDASYEPTGSPTGTSESNP